ncbi:MAG: adenylosuccinate lyase [Bacteroidales bacterium]
MELNSLNAISPVDGRYRKHTESLGYFFSEGALINYRIFVEISYFIALLDEGLPQLESFDRQRVNDLQELARNFGFKDAAEVKKIEATTNHDVKAVEYYLKKEFDRMGLGAYKEFIHFGLTSQDITNTAQPYAFRLASEEIIYPQLDKLLLQLIRLQKEWKNIPMLAHTHGQPASPTKLGKEIGVFAERLRQQLKWLKAIPFTAKFGGATGNFNAHYAAYPEIDWEAFANGFIKSLGLERQKMTTQIENYDFMAAWFDNLKRINTILIDLCRDMWTYISMDYFKQKINPEEVGSSTMPHKVNPIDFENAEGNLGLANAQLEFLAAKLPVSRLQRDLTDSTVLRNVGVPVAHSLIAWKMISRGLNKLVLNREKIDQDLENNWAVVAEAIQTILRRENYPKAYEKLKELTRTNEPVTKERLHDFINKLKVSQPVKEEMLKITPFNYTGK